MVHRACGASGGIVNIDMVGRLNFLPGLFYATFPFDDLAGYPRTHERQQYYAVRTHCWGQTAFSFCHSLSSNVIHWFFVFLCPRIGFFLFFVPGYPALVFFYFLLPVPASIPHSHWHHRRERGDLTSQCSKGRLREDFSLY